MLPSLARKLTRYTRNNPPLCASENVPTASIILVVGEKIGEISTLNEMKEMQSISKCHGWASSHWVLILDSINMFEDRAKKKISKWFECWWFEEFAQQS